MKKENKFQLYDILNTENSNYCHNETDINDNEEDLNYNSLNLNSNHAQNS